MKIGITDLKFDSNGLIPAVVQDARTRRILMLAYMNQESLARTIDSGETWFWSRSRSELWHKGETSGNTQQVVDMQVDCDLDALTVLVKPNGPACHTGAESCFDNGSKQDLTSSGLGVVLDDLYALVELRKRELPESSYTTYLFNEGLDKILKKLAEETGETIIAAKNKDHGPLIKETADLLYHLVVLLVERNVTLDEVSEELRARRKKETE
ncbi:MAG TPA: bifunctional phosphoribosyl-AMP cyclohydrolase/phosphoribosyl-ATP diphosphatase HisIE [Pyrinomonadaceae bacterium]|jgi:phosphoribosyl-ATP pyrophosphohydrolase/phosphoribosyl-AMP cyclohydrolase